MTQLVTEPETIPTSAVTCTVGTAQASPVAGGLVLVLACAAMAVVSLDMAIVNVALPSIQHDLGLAQGALQWVVVAYGLLLGGFLLFGGRMTDQLGRRRIFIAGLTIFTGASFLAGAAQDGGVLIAARALQGFGAALTAPAALSLIAVTFPQGRERNRALGIFAAVGGVAGSLGVVAGGLLAAGPGWRWAFFINVPIGVVMSVLAAAFLRSDGPVDRSKRLDLAGATTVTSGLLTFVYALHHAANHGWISATTLALFTLAAALLVAFVRIESRSTAALLPLSRLQNRTLLGANATAFVASCAFLSFIFIGSLLMQQALGYTPIMTGLAWLATTAILFVAAMAGGRLATRIGGRRLLITGLALFTAAALWMTRVQADGTYLTDLLPAFLLAGIGFGLVEPALQIGALTGVPESDTGLASGLLETVREIGGAAGVAAVSTILVTGATLNVFRTAFAITAGLAILGLVIATIGFARRS